MEKTLNVPGTWGEPADSLYIGQKIDFSYPIPFRGFKKGFPLWAALAFAKLHYLRHCGHGWEILILKNIQLTKSYSDCKQYGIGVWDIWHQPYHNKYYWCNALYISLWDVYGCITEALQLTAQSVSWCSVSWFPFTISHCHMCWLFVPE